MTKNLSLEYILMTRKWHREKKIQNSRRKEKQPEPDSRRKDGKKTKMYLKRIELIGFKSFATKTVLDFLPSCSLAENGKACGVTAIVGPNGRGKSNVADAIKWAMGEQSLKNIRGKKSEDVIFAGSGKKAQLGSAKGSVFFDNSDKRIPIEFEEVIITRKVYRSGEGG